MNSKDRPSPVKHASAKGVVTKTPSYVGELTFQHQTLSQHSAKKLHLQMALARASELVLWSMPAMNFYQALKACQENLGAEPDDLVIGLYEGIDSVRMFLTANVTTPYTICLFDLSRTGPVVFELPKGEIFGVINDAWQQPIKEIGSEGEKVLLVGPGQDPPAKFDGEVFRTKTFVNFFLYRVLDPDADGLKIALKAYKWQDSAEGTNPPVTQFRRFTPEAGDDIALNTPPTDMGYWELLNEMVQREPMADRDRFFYAWLRDLGIKKGEPFKPTEEQRKVLEEGLKVGLAMAQANSFDCILPACKYGEEDSGWDWVLAGLDPSVDLQTHSMYSERAAYSYEATSTSEGMTSQVSGQGSGYLGTYYDGEGNAFLGEKSYTLHLEPDVPVADFWSVTVYDIKNRVVIRNATGRADVAEETAFMNQDGSYDLYFGPTAPADEDLHENWIQTNPGESWFAYFRAYGPLEDFFNERYQMNPIEEGASRAAG